MNNREKFEAWLEYAQNDLDAAKALFNFGRWRNVAFMCKQSIEKLA
jgi:HEPN domain-containing protein